MIKIMKRRENHITENYKAFILARFVSVTVVLALAILFCVTGKGADRKAMAATTSGSKQIKAISAFYIGEKAVVGKEININDVMVMAVYEDGSNVRLTSGFTLSSKTPTRSGINTFYVYYGQFSTSFEVGAKEIIIIYAMYDGPDVDVGARFLMSNVSVKAYYSDGTDEEIGDFTVSDNLIKVPGDNAFTATYLGKSATFIVPGVRRNIVVAIIATYNGPQLVTGNGPKRQDIEVEAYYYDGTSKTISNYTISPAYATQPGYTDFTIGFEGETDTFRVYVKKKTVIGITATYLGKGVPMGRSINVEDIDVVADYNDGTQGSVKNFTLSEYVIYDEGDNFIYVEYEGFREWITIEGVETLQADFNNAKNGIIYHDGEALAIMVGMPLRMEENDMYITKVGASIVKKAVRKITKSTEYVAFEVEIVDDEWTTSFPLAMRVKRPEGYDPEKFSVYFSPNKKSIMARMNGEFIDDTLNYYEFMIYEPGTYIMIEECEDSFVTEIQSFTKEINLKIGRYYSLEVLVLPLDAQNRNVVYQSSNNKIATVSQTGKVKGVSEGTCEITVTAEDGSKTVLTIPVTITK